jgi:hypothetical protein
LDAGGPDDPTTGRLLDQVLEQGGLADPRLAADDQRPAVADQDGAEKPIEQFALSPAPEQL